MTLHEQLTLLIVAIQFGTILIGATVVSALWQRIQELSDCDDDDDDGDWWKKANSRGNN